MQEDEKTPIFISLSDEVEEVINENRIDLISELNREGLDVERTNMPHRATGDAGTKDPVLIILASSVAVGAVSMGIAKIIQALGNRPVVTKNRKLVPLTDGSGRVLRDENGKIIKYWAEESSLLEPQKAQGKDRLSASFGGEQGLHFEYATNEEK